MVVVKNIRKDFAEPADAAYIPVPDVANDTVNPVSRALYVGTGGDLLVQMAGEPGGTNVMFRNIQSGTILPISVRRISDIITTAADIVVLH